MLAAHDRYGLRGESGHPVAIGPHSVDPGSAGLRKGRLADRMRLALAEAGGFRVGFARADGGGCGNHPVVGGRRRHWF